VLDRIEAESGETAFLDDPFAPVFDVLLDFGVGVVDVGEHEEVCVAGLFINGVGPMFIVAQNPENGLFLGGSIVVCPAEVLPVVFLAAVFVVAAGEIEANPCLDIVGFRDFFCAV
jgi:hypothetical protein